MMKKGLKMASERDSRAQTRTLKLTNFKISQNQKVDFLATFLYKFYVLTPKTQRTISIRKSVTDHILSKIRSKIFTERE